MTTIRCISRRAKLGTCDDRSRTRLLLLLLLLQRRRKRGAPLGAPAMQPS